jgi:molybdate transport system ATP-binding protein
MTLRVDVRVPRDGFEVEAAFEASPGQTVALLGPNGAGKSTVVAAVAGLVEPSAGTVVLDGRTLDDAAGGVHLPPEERPVGVVFQDLLLFPHLTATENVAFPLRARGVPRAAARARAEALLERMGLGERAAARPGRLSGGEAQRVALARALVAEPRLLLLDEPTSALDVQAKAELRPLVQSILGGFEGIRVLVTHDPVEAMTLADRLVLIESGVVTQQGTPTEIREAPRTHYAAELVGLNLFVGRLTPLEHGAGRLATRDGDLVVAWPVEATGPVEEAVGLVRPADVSLHLTRPEGGSARNVLEGKIAGVTFEADRARVRVASSPRVVADVTLGSVARLGLRGGIRVWAAFKAVEVRVLLP